MMKGASVEEQRKGWCVIQRTAACGIEVSSALPQQQQHTHCKQGPGDPIDCSLQILSSSDSLTASIRRLNHSSSAHNFVYGSTRKCLLLARQIVYFFQIQWSKYFYKLFQSGFLILNKKNLSCLSPMQSIRYLLYTFLVKSLILKVAIFFTFHTSKYTM